ncbi:MAG: 30S ribosome-binding factor RbfA [Chloroflexi bacterium]|nr:30S ribosome-binding factor RbfA [Chloroflexota bacterium]
MSHRIERINNLIRREISDMLQRQVNDPRLGSFVTVTEVSTTSDLKYAKIFVSRIGSEEEKRETLTVLTDAAGFFRSELSRRLEMRRIPELSFRWDESLERGARLTQLIDQVTKQER